MDRSPERPPSGPSSLRVWLYLMVLLAIGIVVAYTSLPKTAIVLIVFTTAAIKIGLVAFNYMHLRFERIFIYVLAIVPVVLVITLLLTLIPDIALRIQT